MGNILQFFVRILKIARTIVDLEEVECISAGHIAEAPELKQTMAMMSRQERPCH